ncbi:metallophosphoesterase family protein [Paenibacillus allorhizosphaerae]|uniref:Calcineurin-like phosphoesterase domain-containing protein n=1 Tax=Paenibacillus allorhizosphaerae TaxID=2849866 RepID=A0ABN7TQ07_9BACL|nr:metallophosphoesterase family protein [Paenibacillus allorhizosphaerae]CAG7650600.1 hypothetical protein PAECIP111802_04761 [Paenibacillus allorhizosphaerae]
MDNIAIISDIHGNIPALEAVASDIRNRGIRRIICLGDLVGKGPQPAEAVERIRELCEMTVLGNWDLGIGRPQVLEAGKWQLQQLSASRLNYLAQLPFCAELTMSGRRIRLVHASAKSVYHRVHREANKEEQLAMFANTELTGDFDGISGLAPDVVGYGDIHVPFVHTLESKERQGLMLFNTGSVGAPYDGLAQASYAILEGIANETRPAPFSVRLVRVPYDVERVIAIAERAGMPQLDRFCYEMRAGLEQQ